MSARARKAVAAVTHSKRDKPGRKSDKPAAGTVGLKYACTVEIIFMIRIMNTRGFVELVVLQFLPASTQRKFRRKCVSRALHLYRLKCIVGDMPFHFLHQSLSRCMTIELRFALCRAK